MVDFRSAPRLFLPSSQLAEEVTFAVRQQAVTA
jgi:hypothetical protein